MAFHVPPCETWALARLQSPGRRAGPFVMPGQCQVCTGNGEAEPLGQRTLISEGEGMPGGPPAFQVWLQDQEQRDSLLACGPPAELGSAVPGLAWWVH